MDVLSLNHVDLMHAVRKWPTQAVKLRWKAIGLAFRYEAHRILHLMAKRKENSAAQTGRDPADGASQGVPVGEADGRVATRSEVEDMFRQFEMKMVR